MSQASPSRTSSASSCSRLSTSGTCLARRPRHRRVIASSRRSPASKSRPSRPEDGRSDPVTLLLLAPALQVIRDTVDILGQLVEFGLS